MDLGTQDFEHARRTLAGLLATLGRSIDAQDSLALGAVLSDFRGHLDRLRSAGAIARNSWIAYRSNLAQIPAEWLGRPASQLTPESVEAWVAGSDWSPVSCKQRVQVLRRALTWALRSRLIAVDPLEGMRRVGGRAARARLPSDDQVGRWLAHCPPELRIVGEFLRDTGARPCEARAIEARHLAGEWVTLTRHKTSRFGGERRIWLPEPWPARLAELAKSRPTGPLFRNSRGGAWEQTALSIAFIRAKNRAKVSGVVIYSLRHRAASRWIEKGVDVLTVAHQLGHASPKMTLDTYCQTSPEHVARALKKAAG